MSEETEEEVFNCDSEEEILIIKKECLICGSREECGCFWED